MQRSARSALRAQLSASCPFRTRGQADLRRVARSVLPRRARGEPRHAGPAGARPPARTAARRAVGWPGAQVAVHGPRPPAAGRPGAAARPDRPRGPLDPDRPAGRDRLHQRRRGRRRPRRRARGPGRRRRAADRRPGPAGPRWVSPPGPASRPASCSGPAPRGPSAVAGGTAAVGLAAAARRRRARRGGRAGRRAARAGPGSSGPTTCWSTTASAPGSWPRPWSTARWLGVGLNVTLRADELPPDVAATSLRLAKADGHRPGPAAARAAARRGGLVRAMAGGRRRRDGCGLRAAYPARCATIGREVRALLPGGGERHRDGDGNRRGRAARPAYRRWAARDRGR